MEKNDQLFCCLIVLDFELKYYSKVYIYQILKKMFGRRKVYILFIQKIKNKYMSAYYV